MEPGDSDVDDVGFTKDAKEHHKNNAKDLTKTGVKNGVTQEDDWTEEGDENPAESDSVAPRKGKATFKERWKNPEYRRKCMRTVWLGASFWALGFSIGQRGPAFLDLQIITQTDVEAASFFFTASSVGYLVGSLVAGVVYDKLNKSALLLLAVFGMAVTTVVLPWCSIYGLMIAIHFLCSIFGGGLDTIGNADLLRIWGKEGEVAMQFVHFSFAFGGVIGPLATEPFLTPNPEDDLDLSPTTSPDFNDSSLVTVNTTNNFANGTVPLSSLTTIVHYAYMISGSTILLVCIPLTVQIFTDRSQKRRQSVSDQKVSMKQPLPLGLFLFVQSTLCFFYFLYCATEDTFAAYLTAYVVKGLHWTKTDGAQITSLFWASFAVGRFTGIFVVHYLSPVKFLVLCCTSLSLSLLAFLIFSQLNISEGLWVATFAIGSSMSIIFPCGFTWMENELVRVTGRVASSILIASSSGTMVNPIVLGYLMQELTPMWYCYLLFGEGTLCLLVFLGLLAFSRLYLKKHYRMSEREESSHEVNVPAPAELETAT